MLQPEQALARAREKLCGEWMLCFGAALGIGLLTHLYKLTNFLPNWDSLLNLHADQNKTELGRCFLQYACAVSSYYDLPWVNGLLSLVWNAASAACVAGLFGIQSKMPLILTGGLMASFPTVTSTLAYNYTADGYFLALLCMCAAVLLAVRSWRGVLPAAALIAFGLGVYQAYITFAMVLMLLYLVDQLLFRELEPQRFWALAGRFAACGLLGAAGYWAALRLLVWSGVQLSGYQNIDQAFSLQDFRPLYALLRAGYRFLTWFFDFSQGIRLFTVLNVLLTLLLAGLFWTAFRVRGMLRRPRRLALVLLCMAAIPAASFALYFVNPYLDYHNLMVMCLCLVYFLPVLFYERLEGLPSAAAAAKRWAILMLSALTIFNFVLLANISYQKLEMAYVRSFGVILRVADRIETLPGALDCTKLAVVGCLPGSEAISVNVPPEMTGVTDSYILRRQDVKMGENVTQAMLRDYCGIRYEDTTGAEVEAIVRSEEFGRMDCWPAQSSVAVIGDTLVIRFGEETDE